MCRSAQLPSSCDNDYLTEAQRELVLREGMDCFCNLLAAADDRLAVAKALAAILGVSHDKLLYMHERHKPELKPRGGVVQVGRMYLDEIDGTRVAARLCSKGAWGGWCFGCIACIVYTDCCDWCLVWSACVCVWCLCLCVWWVVCRG